MAFTLHPQLAADCLVLADLPLSRLLLMNESRYPWFILVPRRADLREIHHLPQTEQRQFWHESAWLSTRIEQQFSPDKLNIAALGNMVPQLHIHHIARFQDDAAWPAPVWGKFTPEKYEASELQDKVALFQQWLHDTPVTEAP